MQAIIPMGLSQKNEKLWTSCTFAKNSILPLLEISARYVARKIETLNQSRDDDSNII